MTKVRVTTGLSESDVTDAKVFMRTLTDALNCAEEIASKEAARAHYKDQVRILMRGIRFNKMVIDRSGEVVCSQDPSVVAVYNLMRLSQSVVRRYGLQTSNFSSLKDVE